MGQKGSDNKIGCDITGCNCCSHSPFRGTIFDAVAVGIVFAVIIFLILTS